MSHINHRRTWMSRILLAVFVPMLMLSALHIHTEGYADDSGCDACMHHVRHSHVSTAGFCIGQCVLCQFQSLPLIIAVLTAFSVPFTAHIQVITSIRYGVLSHTAEATSLRAPPLLM